jgi:hypothetical protein
MAKFGLVTNMQIDEENNLDIFEMSTRTNEPPKEVENKKLLMFKRFQVDVTNNKCLLRVVGKTQVFISNCGISCLSDFWRDWFSNRN